MMDFEREDFGRTVGFRESWGLGRLSDNCRAIEAIEATRFPNPQVHRVPTSTLKKSRSETPICAPRRLWAERPTPALTQNDGVSCVAHPGGAGLRRREASAEAGRPHAGPEGRADIKIWGLGFELGYMDS